MDQRSEFDESRIERAKRGIYGQAADEATRDERATLSPQEIDVASDWGDTQMTRKKSRRHGGRATAAILKTLVVLAVLTSFVSGGYLLYTLWNPFSLSPDNIEIAVDVPVAVTPGVPADIVVRVMNNNRAPLEYANLTIVYPPGTRLADDPDKDVRDEKKILNVVPSNGLVKHETRAVFLGEENKQQDVRAVLEFRFKGVNSVFTKEETRPIRMLAAPINLTVDTLKEINVGQELELAVTAASNTTIPLRDILLKVEYPLGFTFRDAEPKPTLGNNIWRVGAMEPSKKFSVKIRGVLEGVDTQERVFTTTIGAGGDRSEREVETPYSRVLSSVRLMRPFIGIRLAMNGKPAAEVSVPYNQRVDGTVHWQNNLPTRVVNAEIEVKLRGVGFDRRAVIAGSGGFYRSLDDTIFWDERGNEALAVLEAGESGSVSFEFIPLPPVSGNQLTVNPEIIAEVSVRGKRYDENGVPEAINTFLSQNVRVISSVQFASRAVYYTGPFANYGPIPPKVEQETSYTIIWSIVNTSNAVRAAEVRATLPAYVAWARMVSPSREDVTYNPSTHEVVWKAGDIPAGTGIGSSPPREVAFQVVMTPSLSQIGSTVPLVTKTAFRGVDTFTGAEITQQRADATTHLSTDPKAKDDHSRVVP